MAAEPTGKITQLHYSDLDSSNPVLTTCVRFIGTDPEEVFRAFFFDSFYRPDAPVLWAMTCTSEDHHYTGASGSFFAIEGFRPTHLQLFPALGNTFRLEWAEDLIKGQMHGALWKASWHSRFKRLSGGCEMLEEFRIEGAPDPEAFVRSPLRQLFNTWSWASNRLPVVGGINKTMSARLCAELHKLHSPYDKTIPKRIKALRRSAP